MENNLPPNQLKAIELLVLGKPILQVAKECKVDQRTVLNWRKNSQFQQELEKQKTEIYEQAINAIRSMTGIATKQLGKLISDVDTPHSTRMKAIEFVINSIKPEQQKLDLLEAVKTLVENGVLPSEVLEKVGTAFSKFEQEIKQAFVVGSTGN
ncbi:MAG TPA: phBC6A51 family helix-turn-helix protein [Oculatellaceae cyanobacterium]|jgi:hypothetical protein